jgi:hypothetical protein
MEFSFLVFDILHYWQLGYSIHWSPQLTWGHTKLQYDSLLTSAVVSKYNITMWLTTHLSLCEGIQCDSILTSVCVRKYNIRMWLIAHLSCCEEIQHYNVTHYSPQFVWGNTLQCDSLLISAALGKYNITMWLIAHLSCCETIQHYNVTHCSSQLLWDNTTLQCDSLLTSVCVRQYNITMWLTTHLSLCEEVNRQKLAVTVHKWQECDLQLIRAQIVGPSCTAAFQPTVRFHRNQSREMASCVAQSQGWPHTETLLPQ